VLDSGLTAIARIFRLRRTICLGRRPTSPFDDASYAPNKPSSIRGAPRGERPLTTQLSPRTDTARRTLSKYVTA
jgi:hypothetical protein